MGRNKSMAANIFPTITGLVRC